MNHGTAAEAGQSIRSKSVFATILEWIFGIRAGKHISQPAHLPSTEDPAERAPVEARAAQVGAGNTDAKLTAAKSFTIASKDDGNVGAVAASGISQTFPDQQEIERRRVLVRVLFNDFWNSADNKPAAFAERLDQAEDYLNARLAAHGEPWRLDANTRPMLGLPPRSSSAN
jgi:hypothetical protein